MLRITEGEHRGRKLMVPAVAATRPLVERARVGMFNHLRGLIVGATVWDLYAGSGILGLEALSRGAERVLAVEQSAKAVAQLQENARLLGLEGRVRVLRADAHRLLAMLVPGAADAAPDLLFFDPPYADFAEGGPRRKRVWELFCTLVDRLQPGGVGVAHTPRGILLTEETERLPGIEQRNYGSTSLYWWHRPE
jgi:16S rRNA (guanine966-N2)-methyltransferase